MILKLFLAFLVIALNCFGNGLNNKPIVVAVIDTGYGFSVNGKKPDTSFLCDKGHINFNKNNYDYTDNHGHGTNVSGIIHRYANGANYCQVIVKFWDKDSDPGDNNLKNLIRGIRWATRLNVDIINISAGGEFPDDKEKRAVLAALNKNIVIVTAAGNSGKQLKDEDCYYPACYDPRIIVVGSLNKKKKKMDSSNYGPYVKVWELGFLVESNNLKMSGTSQATAIATGKIVYKLWKFRNKLK